MQIHPAQISPGENFDLFYFLRNPTDGTTYYVDVYNHPVKLQQGITGGAGIAWDWVRNKLLIAQPTVGVVIAPGPVVSGY